MHNRTRQVSRIAARPQAQRVAAVPPDEHALRQLNRCSSVQTIPALAAGLQRLLKLGSAIRLQAACACARAECAVRIVLAAIVRRWRRRLAGGGCRLGEFGPMTSMASASSAVTLIIRSG